MSVKKLLANLSLTLRPRTVIGRCFASKSPHEIFESAQEEPIFAQEVDKEIEQKRNKSRLNSYDRNVLFNQKPYERSQAWYHDTVKYKRRILGRYGMEALGVPAGLAWPTPEEVEDAKEYERVAFPLTLQERWQKIKEEHRKKEEATTARQNQIFSKMLKMNEMIVEVEAKVAKKAAEAEEARLKKERRLREIRHQLGVAGYVTSDKIKEMMDKLEKEDKKKKKEAKKLRIIERQKQLLSKDMPIEESAETESDAAGRNKAPESGKGSPETEEPKK